MEIIKTDKSPQAIGPYSQATFSNSFIFISGQLPIDPKNGTLISGTIEEKTTLVMNNISSILDEKNMDFSNIVKSTIYVKNLDNFSKINNVYGSFFKNKIYPARETVQVAKLPLDADVEISVIASI